MEDQSKAEALIRLGTRGSKLALAQAYETKRRLGGAFPELAPDHAVEIVEIKTTGDKVQDRALAEIGGKGLFMKEIEAALLERRIDIAVHSTKDVETFLTEVTELAAILPREDPRDALVSPVAKTIDELPEGAVIGTASVRRAAQLLARRPDFKTILYRGNVQTRLRKLEEGVCDATLLAYAGLKRLDLADRATRVLEPEEMLPAVAQGAISVQCRSGLTDDDRRILDWVRAINDAESETRVRAERAMLARLDGSCRTPIGGLAELTGNGVLRLRGCLAAIDGSALYSAEATGPADDPETLGEAVGEELIAQAGPAYRV
ncbi:hydroxymethylbilane synthase [Nisaea acidiphila]|uniref:Porphobilinogen deaminase n=1 Tax=Nisaea acidiphila TaxID=1862145 RepID=A0A9J7AMX5_9PROT|nr:hydroxymethylbilane synthase [Nisaea acidiphila]UUX48518.1 hydroxymethylbilane synthase [Nisaea acidiphila]